MSTRGVFLFFSTFAPDPLLLEHSTRIKTHAVLTPLLQTYLKKYAEKASTMKLYLIKTQEPPFVHGFLHSDAIPSSTVIYFEQSHIGLFIHPSLHNQQKLYFCRFGT